MAIDGLIVLDSTNARPIVQSSFRSFPPAYPLLHINAYSNAIAKALRPEDVDPVLLVTLLDAPTACCHLQHLSLTFLCPISNDSEFLCPICVYGELTSRKLTHYMRSHSSAHSSTSS
jgi:AP-3 complex subunit mu